MKLKEIILSGFKSFPKKTRFKLKDGITTFVGPNGCGKTNIIDAIKWCLGEMSIKSLRAERMEDLIFSGTEERSAVGMAEVRMIFENNGGIPIDYDEVEIKRRFFRSGESKFMINNTPCRLRDIQNLFANTGLNSSILDQQTIEDFLISDSELRREILESIAGIKRYRVDRKEAVNKLNQVERTLEKIDVILKEKKKTIRSIKREANRAKRVKKLRNELKDKAVQWGEFRLHGLNSQLNKLQKTLEKHNGKLDSILSSINRKKGRLRTYEDKLADGRKDYREVLVENEELQQKIQNLREKKAGLEGELKGIENLLSNLPDDINSEIDDLEVKLKGIRDKRKSITDNIPELKSRSEKINSQLNRVLEQKSEITGEKLTLNIKMEEQESRIESIEESIEESEEKLKVKEEELRKIGSHTADNDSELKENASDINKLKDEIDSLENEKSAILREFQNKKSDLNEINREIEFYKSREIELSEGMKLLKEKMNLPLLSDAIEVEAGFEAAVETVLGNFINGMVGSEDEIKKAVELIKEESAKGGMLILADKRKSGKKEGLAARISGEYFEIVEDRLSTYRVVDNIRDAIENSIKEGGKWVTKDGDLVEDGFIKISHGKEGIFIRRAQEKKLREKKEELIEDIEGLEKKKSEILNRLNKLNNKLSAKERKREELVNKKSELEFELNRIEYEIESIKEDLGEDRNEIKEIRKSISELEKRKNDIDSRIEGIEIQIRELDNRKEEIEKELAEIEQKRDKLGDEESEINQRINNLREGLKLKGEKEELKNEIKYLMKEINELNSKLEEKKKRAQELNHLLEEKENSIKNLREEYSNLQDERNNLEREIDNIKMEISQKEYEKKNISDDIFKEFGIEIQGRDVSPEENIDVRINEIREKIDSLLPINPLAIEQYEEKKEELDELKDEHSDLIDSTDDIKDSIKEIDHKAAKQFKETFTDIKEDFQNIYEQLSPEGQADIRLSEGNILEADIEVWVRPSGKSLKRMELFSTGEKTLAAVALLLAIMRKRQSPIYIMDEIDAPLDENNIERFISLLNEFSETAQIILVTHNRRTMEAADSIYGITMEEKGVSTVLSLDLNEIKELEEQEV